MASCSLCNKKSTAGNKVSHSNRHTKRRFYLNTRKMRFDINGKNERRTICMSCLKTMYKPRV